MLDACIHVSIPLLIFLLADIRGGGPCGLQKGITILPTDDGGPALSARRVVQKIDSADLPTPLIHDRVEVPEAVISREAQGPSDEPRA